MVRSIVILLLILLLPARAAWGQCPDQDYSAASAPDFGCVSPGERDMAPQLGAPDSLPVRSGETVTAPWDGALVHRDRLLEVGLQIKGLRRLRWIDRLQLSGNYTAQRDYLEALLVAEQAHQERLRDRYEAQLDKLNEQLTKSSAWYRSAWFGIVVGIAVTSLAVAALAFLLN